MSRCTTSYESALVILVPEAEAVVGRLRQRYDLSAAVGMPTHITLNYPFLPGLTGDTETSASVSHRDGNYQIYTVSPEGGEAMRVTRADNEVHDPALNMVP
jgi:hypothetical protein